MLLHLLLQLQPPYCRVTTLTFSETRLVHYTLLLLLRRPQTYTDPKTNATTVLANACNPSFMMCYNTAANSGRRLLQDSDGCKVYNTPSTTKTLNISKFLFQRLCCIVHDQR
jgi:hypothetical protein